MTPFHSANLLKHNNMIFGEKSIHQTWKGFWYDIVAEMLPGNGFSGIGGRI